MACDMWCLLFIFLAYVNFLSENTITVPLVSVQKVIDAISGYTQILLFVQKFQVEDDLFTLFRFGAGRVWSTVTSQYHSAVDCS